MRTDVNKRGSNKKIQARPKGLNHGFLIVSPDCFGFSGQALRAPGIGGGCFFRLDFPS